MKEKLIELIKSSKEITVKDVKLFLTEETGVFCQYQKAADTIRLLAQEVPQIKYTTSSNRSKHYFWDTTSTTKVEKKEKKDRAVDKRLWKTYLEMVRIFHIGKGEATKEVLIKALAKTIGRKSVPTLPRYNRLIQKEIDAKSSIIYENNRYIYKGDTALALSVLERKFKELFGEELDNSKYKMMKPIPTPVEAQVIKAESKNSIRRWQIISALQILQTESQQYVETVSIVSTVREWHYVSLTALEVESILSAMSREHSGLIERSGLGKKWKIRSFDLLRSIYNPKLIKKSVIARIGVSLDYIRKQGLDAHVVSSITECDNIYQLDIDMSYSTLESLEGLYRTFRGSDKIFDPEMEQLIESRLQTKALQWNKLTFIQKIKSLE